MTKKKRRRTGLPIIIILLVLLLSVLGGGAYVYINGNKLMLPGQWSREVDITGQVISEATKYIETAAFSDDINMADYISDVSFQSLLEVSKDGNIDETFSEDEYNQVSAQCYAGLENAVRDLIEKRIKDNYIDTDMSVDELMKESFDMSLSEYIKAYGPKLVPDYSELVSQYGMSATYEATKDGLSINHTDGTMEECKYAVSHGMLVIDYSDGAVVYYER